MKLFWTFENCPCWENARNEAARLGMLVALTSKIEKYTVEASSSGDVLLAGRVTCDNCGSVRAGTAQMNWSS